MNILARPVTVSKLQAVNLKYQLGEWILAVWRPRLLVLIPDDMAPPNWPPAPDELAKDMPEEAAGMLCRKVAAAQFPEGVGRHGGFLRYVPYKDILYFVTVAGTFDDYLKQFSPKSRQNLVRSVRNFLKRNEGTSVLEISTTPTEIVRFHAEAAAISSQTYQTKMLDLGLPGTEAFRSHLVHLAERQEARGYILRDQGQAIAFAWCQLYGSRLVYSIVGYLPEHTKLSPGTVLLYLLIEDVFKNEVCKILDFGNGQAQYKSMFSTDHKEFIDVYLLRRGTGNWLRIWALHGLTRASTAIGNALDNWGVKKRVKALLRALRA